MLDTLLANFPKGSLVAVIGDPAAFIADPHVCLLPADRSLLRAHMHSLQRITRRDGASIVVVCPAAKGRPAASLYGIPMDIGVAADVVVCPNESGSYTVLKNRFGHSNYCVYPTVPIPEPQDLIPPMTNDEINASSSSLPIAATSEQTARFMATVYAWMGAGVATSATTAYLVAQNPNAHAALTTGATGICVLLAPFALIVALGFLSYKRRPYFAATLYVTLTSLIGVMLSSIAVKAGSDAAFASDAVTSLVVSAGMFAGLAFVGWTTKRDLSGWGTFLAAALWGLILAMVVNVFAGSTLAGFLINAAAVLLFSAMTAYDVQTAKRSAHLGMSAAVVCALSLYLDFLNLFTSILGLSHADD